MVTGDFNWSESSVLSVKASISGNNVNTIIDTGCSGVVISKGCLDCLQIPSSESIDFCVSTSLSVSNKKREFVENLVIMVGPVIKGFPALVLNGAHFDLLLRVNWIEETNARLDVANWKVYFGSVPVELSNAVVPQVELLVA